MKKPVLVIMAAGMGSRYGGLKQIDPIDARGHIIMDYSIYDAQRAGFEKVIFIIKEENRAAFQEVIGDRVAKTIEVSYVYQNLSDVPDGLKVPEGRQKPWGTGHAVYAARDVIDGPFVVINADDYYGSKAFSLIYQFLTSAEQNDLPEYAMVSYILENTLTENGHVSRGVCSVDAQGYLTDIVERTRIEKTARGAAFSEDGGSSWEEINPKAQVSMNFWGFTFGMMEKLEQQFAAFLEKSLSDTQHTDPLKCEFYLPFAVDEQLKAGDVRVRVLNTKERWYGVTYQEDKEMVVAAIEHMVQEGKYPEVF